MGIVSVLRERLKRVFLPVVEFLVVYLKSYQVRQFLYAILSTVAAFGYFHTWSRGSDGGWIFWWSIGLFALLLGLDWLVSTRVARSREPTAASEA